MRVSLHCFQCSEDQSSSVHPRVAVRDEGVYEYICPKGHKTVYILQAQRFEVLSELAVSAILDGYYREAVANFTSSLERLFEFFIKVKLDSVGVSKEAVEEFWKKISSQSERQLGAFLFSYIDSFGESPKLLHQKQVEFRNAVIHKGKLPSRPEAIMYGQSVLDVMHAIRLRMQQSYSESVHKLTAEYIFSLPSQPGFQRATAWTATVFSLVDTEGEVRSLEETLISRRRAREIMGGK